MTDIEKKTPSLEDQNEFMSAVVDALETKSAKFFGDIPFPEMIECVKKGVAAALVDFEATMLEIQRSIRADEEKKTRE